MMKENSIELNLKYFSYFSSFPCKKRHLSAKALRLFADQNYWREDVKTILLIGYLSVVLHSLHFSEIKYINIICFIKTMDILEILLFLHF